MVAVTEVVAEVVEDEVPKRREEAKRHLQDHQAHQDHPGVPSILIFLQESGQGVICTENSDEEHISVLNLQRAPGRTSMQSSQTNETKTSLASLRL